MLGLVIHRFFFFFFFVFALAFAESDSCSRALQRLQLDSSDNYGLGRTYPKGARPGCQDYYTAELQQCPLALGTNRCTVGLNGLPSRLVPVPLFPCAIWTRLGPWETKARLMSDDLLHGWERRRVTLFRWGWGRHESE